MNREIEFRWWSKRYNRMFNSHQELDDWASEQYRKEQYKFDYGFEKDEWYTTMYQMELNFNIQETRDCVPMQYTGLKDTNGVKIFEGDILKSAGYPAIEVIYDKESCSFKMKVHYIGWENLLILSSNKTPYLEVIGNIYENPELLEVE